MWLFQDFFIRIRRIKLTLLAGFCNVPTIFQKFEKNDLKFIVSTLGAEKFSKNLF